MSLPNTLNRIGFRYLIIQVIISGYFCFSASATPPFTVPPVTALQIPHVIRDEDPDQGRKYTTLPGPLEGYLISPENFKKDYTEDGKLFHGTKKFEYVQFMIKTGFFASQFNGQWGIHGHFDLPPDTGTYLSPLQSLSIGFSGGANSVTGALLVLRLKNSNRIRILDMRTVPAVEFKRIEDEAKMSPEKDFNLYLARQYGIDIVIPPTVDNPPHGKPSELLLLNRGVLDFPRSFYDMAVAQKRTFEEDPIRIHLSLYSKLLLVLVEQEKDKRVHDLPSTQSLAHAAFVNKKKNWNHLSQEKKLDLVDLINEMAEDQRPPILDALLNDEAVHRAVLNAIPHLSGTDGPKPDPDSKDLLLSKAFVLVSKYLNEDYGKLDYHKAGVISQFLASLTESESKGNQKALNRAVELLEVAKPEVQKSIISKILYDGPKNNFWIQTAFKKGRPANVWREAFFLLSGTNSNVDQNNLILLAIRNASIENWQMVSNFISQRTYAPLDGQSDYYASALSNGSEEIRLAADAEMLRVSFQGRRQAYEKAIASAMHPELKEWLLKRVVPERPLSPLREALREIDTFSGTSNPGVLDSNCH